MRDLDVARPEVRIEPGETRFPPVALARRAGPLQKETAGLRLLRRRSTVAFATISLCGPEGPRQHRTSSMSRDGPSEVGNSAWEPTSWTTIIQARSGASDTERERALARIAERYQRPIRAEIQRRWQCSLDEAEDLRQTFFVEILQRDFLGSVGPEKGRFRAFVKACISNFLKDRLKERMALKRGAGRKPLSLDQVDDEGHALPDPADPSIGPDIAFDVAWAHQVIEVVKGRTRIHWASVGKASLFDALHNHLGGAGGDEPYASVGQRFGMSEGAVKAEAHRLRQCWRQFLEQEVQGTVGPGEDWREELRYLVQLLARTGGG